MKKEILAFIHEWNLSPFSKARTSGIKGKGKEIFKTKDARSVANKATSLVSEGFHFKDTSNIWEFFSFNVDRDEILRRQEFFKSLEEIDGSFLSDLKEPKPFWNPDYAVIVVTEEDSTFKTLQEMGCSVKYVVDDNDILDLERYDTVQVIDCPNFSAVLERLPQSVFLNSVDEAYLERYVRILSGWKNNLDLLSVQKLPEDVKAVVDELNSLSYLFDRNKRNKLTREAAEDALENVKEEFGKKLKEMSISGDILLEFLNKGSLPKDFTEVVNQAIRKTGMPENIFVKSVPLRLDDKELEKTIRDQSLNEYADSAEEVKKHSKVLMSLPEKLEILEEYLIFTDFQSGVVKWMDGKEYPIIGDSVLMEKGLNEFLDKPSPISFHLNESHKCSILTGANSGGKTTLLEHFIQVLTYSYLGLAVRGKVEMRLFDEVYYFAKNKGSANKGAFETLLTQLSMIRPESKSLILADEIEAVTEPGVAGKMIAASAQFFIGKGCYLIIATHLGGEIQKILPSYSRIDGIEAKGLDEFNELIVDHNPVIGKLASSTPELIVEKMAKTSDKEYFKFLDDFLKAK